jgi:hypothetical protein
VVAHASPYSGYADSGVVRRGRVRWLATVTSSEATPNTVRVYRWNGVRWSLQGSARLPVMSDIRSGGYMTAASATHSGAPDFAVNTFGADTHWFAIVARIHGRWQAARFAGDYDSPTQIDASGVERGLVKAETNGCGCAGGPETYSWYRFGGDGFVPAAPPGVGPQCTASALDEAEPLMTSAPSVEPELLGRLRDPFRVGRAACADGWALAVGTRRGRPLLGVFEQQGMRWLRSAVGPASLMGRAAGPLAIPESVLRGLGRRLGVRLGRTPHYSQRSASPSIGLPRPERTTVAVAVTPGSLYAADYASRRLVVALESHHRDGGSRATVTVHIFRWQRTSWATEATVRFERTTRFPQTLPERRYISVNHDVSFTDSREPDFTVSALGLPGWFAVISHVGGAWHAVPLGSERHAPLAIDGYTYVAPDVEGFAVGGRTSVEYRFLRGRFRVRWRATQPTCDPRTLNAIARQRTHFTRSACAYGWALAVGARHGKPVVGVFEQRGVGAPWSADQILSRAELDAHPDYTDVDPTLLKELERRLAPAAS